MPRFGGLYFENEQVKWIDSVEVSSLEECYPTIYECSFENIAVGKPIKIDDKFGLVGTFTIIETYYPYRVWWYVE